jgi:hypothetical protein
MKKKSSSTSVLFHPRFVLGLVLCSIGIFLAMYSFAGPKPKPSAGGSGNGPGVTGPLVSVSQRAASFDGNLTTLPKPTGRLPQLIRREHTRHPEGTVEPSFKGFVDHALQFALPAAPMPTPSANFKGLDYFNWGDGHPPDTVGEVGPNHYIQAVNTSIGVYNKTGTQLAAFTYNAFFVAAGGTGTLCDTDNYGDPTVVYDSLTDRWIISDFAFQTDSGGTPVGPYYECFAVSKTADPIAGGWWLYGMFIDNTKLPDYPKLGVWSDGIYMSANMFDDVDGYVGVRVWAFNRDDFESGAPVRQVSFDTDTSQWSLLPSNFRGTPPPAGRPNYFVSFQENTQFAGTNVRIHQFQVTNWSPPTATFTGPTNVVVTQYREAPYITPYIPELAGETVDSIGDRMMMQNQYRNIGGVESLWDMQTVINPMAGPQTGIRWYQLNVTGNVIATAPVQQSTYSPDTNYRWMGSLAVDKQGNMAMGYSISSPAMFPAIRYSGRLAGDAINTLPQTETSLVEGTGSQTAGFVRWGDYSSMSVDPADDCTFWYTQMYYELPGVTGPGDWQTRIGSFKFPSCVGILPPPLLLASAASRKTHDTAGTYEVDLPLTGNPGIECRTGGANGDYTVAMTFTNPLTAVASATTSCGTATGAIDSGDSFKYIVSVTGCTAAAQTITVGATGVQDNQGNPPISASANMAILLGDTTANGSVNSSDISQTKAQSGTTATSSNFRTDVTINGLINSSDISTVKSKSGTALP